MLNKEEIEVLKKLFSEVIQTKEKSDIRLKINKEVANYLLNCMNKSDQLESDKQKLIEKLENKIEMVEKCHQELIKPYYDEKLKLINTSLMSRKEKEEFINKRNCLLVQKHCYEEILKLVKGEKE